MEDSEVRKLVEDVHGPDDREDCPFAIWSIEDDISHECGKPNNHDGPHRCYACSESW